MNVERFLAHAELVREFVHRQGAVAVGEQAGAGCVEDAPGVGREIADRLVELGDRQLHPAERPCETEENSNGIISFQASLFPTDRMWRRKNVQSVSSNRLSSRGTPRVP